MRLNQSPESKKSNKSVNKLSPYKAISNLLKKVSQYNQPIDLQVIVEKPKKVKQDDPLMMEISNSGCVIDKAEKNKNSKLLIDHQNNNESDGCADKTNFY